jgi:hypothetical protein
MESLTANFVITCLILVDLTNMLYHAANVSIHVSTYSCACAHLYAIHVFVMFPALVHLLYRTDKMHDRLLIDASYIHTYTHIHIHTYILICGLFRRE